MRHLILPALLVLTLSSCSTYQYMTLDSSQLSKNDKKQLTWENDTMRVTYNFNGKNGPIHIDIFNKTSQPIYVNWKKSALIRDERTTSYFDPNVTVFGSGSTVGYRIGRVVSTATTNFSASFALPEGVDFIPPSTAFAKDLPFLKQSGEMTTYISDSIPKEKAIGRDGIYVIKYQRVRFDEGQSPIKFKSYMTFTLGNNNTTEFTETHSFYVGEVLQTGTAPDMFALYQMSDGDKVFVKRPAEMQ